MNAKKAKLLRVHAQEMTLGKPARAYLRHNTTKAIIVHPECTRGVYRHLKRLVKSGVKPWKPAL